MKKIGILGSTGSIGTGALDVIRENKDKFRVEFLSCGSNIDYLSAQIVEFLPKAVAVAREEDAQRLKKQFHGIDIYHGSQGLKDLAGYGEADLVLNGLVGMMGLEPTLQAISAGRDIALANKETLVAGGALVMEAAKAKGVKILPVDSEHSAIFQALQGNEDQIIDRLILTASGGPFRGYSLDELSKVNLAQALKHPNWSMGPKITIDSASMMNKGLEVIEARWLFDVEAEKIEVLVHKESIIHSMVEYQDKSIMAQLGTPDMRLPISYAFSYPDRLKSYRNGVDFLKLGSLHFEPVDMEVFKNLKFAYQALESGGTYPVALNGANEVLVERFLKEEISFLNIQEGVERVLNEHVSSSQGSLEEILEIDKKTREKVRSWVY